MLTSILVFVLVLSVLILVHELGHFIAAKKAGIWVEEFGFGLPPKIIGKKIGETIYSLNALPFGGFVRLHGEMTEEGVTKPNRAFINKSKKVRAVIVTAGVLMNFLLAVVSFAIIYSFSGVPRNSQNVRIVDIKAGSPAQEGGLLVGDIVREVVGEKIISVNQFVGKIEQNRGMKTNVLIERTIGEKSENKKFVLVPRKEVLKDEGPLGVVITSTEIYFPPLWQRPFVGVYYGLKESVYWGKTVVFGFVKIFGDLFKGQSPKDLAGPVGIYAITTQVAKGGIFAILNFVGILSVNLAILNILPFPALDGGRLLFIFIEKAIGKKVVPKIESIIHTIGMVILILLLVAITAHDIQRLILAGSISGFLDSIIK